MNFRLLFSLTILSSLVSCNSLNDSTNLDYAEVNGEKIPIIRLDLVEDSATIIPLSVLFEDVEIIPLETKPECMVGYFSTGMTDHSVLIGARNRSAPIRLYEFDLEGRFIREFGGVGKGPGEHQGYMLGQIYNYPDEGLIMASFYGGPDEEHLFSDEGEFIKSITPAGDMYGGVVRHSEDLFMTSGVITGIPKFERDSFRLVLSNSKGEWLKSFPRTIFPEASKKDYSSTGGVSLWRNKSEWMIYSQGDDTVYQVTPTALVPKAVFYLGSNTFRYNQIVEPQSEVGRFDIEVLQETDQYFYFKKNLLINMEAEFYEQWGWSTMSRLIYSFIVYDKNLGIGYNLRFDDDLLGILPTESLSQKQTWDEFGTVYRIAHAVDVLDWITEAKENNSLPEKARERILELENSIDENSNPVMFIYKERSQKKIGDNLEEYFKKIE